MYVCARLVRVAGHVHYCSPRVVERAVKMRAAMFALCGGSGGRRANMRVQRVCALVCVCVCVGGLCGCVFLLGV